MKRLFDLVFASLILILFLPFGLIICILILISSKGGVFYCQERIGLNGKPFYCRDNHVTKNCEVVHLREGLNFTAPDEETMYNYEEVKHQFVQYEGVSYRCPEAHVGPVACSMSPFAVNHVPGRGPGRGYTFSLSVLWGSDTDD